MMRADPAVAGAGDRLINNKYKYIYDVGGKLSNGIKAIYPHNLAYVKVQGELRVSVSGSIGV